MNILDNFLQNFRSKKTEAPVLHTPHGDLNLAKPRDRKKFQRTVFEIQRVTDALTQQDIGDWRRAWQMALNVDSPNRVKLYGRFYYLIFQTGASRQNLIKPRLSAFVSCKINDLV